jgi:hypothetical protein
MGESSPTYTTTILILAHLQRVLRYVRPLIFCIWKLMLFDRTGPKRFRAPVGWVVAWLNILGYVKSRIIISHLNVPTGKVRRHFEP